VVAVVQGSEVESLDGLLEPSGEVVAWQASLEVEGLGVVVVPEGLEEPSRGRVVRLRDGYEEHEKTPAEKDASKTSSWQMLRPPCLPQRT
jgi:hypothetical protein